MKTLSLIRYELSKLSGQKYIWAVIALFLLANAFMCFYGVSDDLYRVPREDLRDFYEIYAADPDSVDANYREYKALLEEQKEMNENLSDGEEPVTLQLPKIYSAGKDYSDQALYLYLYGETLPMLTSYKSDINAVISRAEMNLEEFELMGIHSDSFNSKYQHEVIKKYTDARDGVRLGFEFVSGWNEYFGYGTVCIFIFLSLLAVAVAVYQSERSSGAIALISVTKHGRSQTAIAKLIAVSLVAVLIALSFTLSTFAIIGIKLGYSSTVNAIQALDSYRYSPHIMTVGEFFAVSLAMRVTASVTFAVLVTAMSTFCRSHLTSYIAGLIVFCGNIMVFSLATDKNGVFLKFSNLYANALVEPLFTRYRAVNIAGAAVPTDFFSCVLNLVVLLFAAAVFIARFTRAHRYVTAKKRSLIAALSRVRAWFSAKQNAVKAKKSLRYYKSGIFASELYKTIVSSRIFIILAVLLFAKILITANEFEYQNNYHDAIYREYMTALEGPLDEKKAEHISSIRRELNEVIFKKDYMESSYRCGEISADEYSEYLSEYYYAVDRAEVFSKITAHADYITEMHESGVSAEFVYDTGWKKLLSSKTDITLYIAVLLVSAYIFTSEYKSQSSSGSFASILRTTKHGRERTFAAKIAVALLSALVFAAVSVGVELAFASHEYELSSAFSPITSIEEYASIELPISIFGFCAAVSVTRCVAAAFLALITVTISVRVRRVVPLLSVTVFLSFVPDLIISSGINFLKPVNFMYFFRGTPLFMYSAESSGSIYLALCFAVVIAVSAATAWLAGRAWKKIL